MRVTTAMMWAENMPAPQNVIAVVFDFDDTLTDDSTTALPLIPMFVAYSKRLI
jgi:hypothetical protein